MGIKCSGKKQKKRRKGKEKKGKLKMNLFTKEKDGKIPKSLWQPHRPT